MAVLVGSQLMRPHRTHLRTRIGIAAVLLGVAALLISGYRFASTHSKYGEWSWGPSPTPPKIQYQGSEYDRGMVAAGSARVQVLPSGLGLTEHGRFAGGSIIFTSNSKPPPVIYLKHGNTYVGYGCRCGSD